MTRCSRVTNAVAASSSSPQPRLRAVSKSFAIAAHSW